MVFLWFSHGFPMVFLCFPMVYLRFSYGFPMFSHDFPMAFLCFPMVFLCFPMVFPWFPPRRRSSRPMSLAVQSCVARHCCATAPWGCCIGPRKKARERERLRERGCHMFQLQFTVLRPGRLRTYKWTETYFPVFVVWTGRVLVQEYWFPTRHAEESPFLRVSFGGTLSSPLGWSPWGNTEVSRFPKVAQKCAKTFGWRQM